MSLPRALYRAAAVRELERHAIEKHGLSADELMLRAGKALFDVLRARFPWASRLLVLCGGGNNGGDGYVLARLARGAGLDVVVCAFADARRLEGAARRAHAAWLDAGGSCEAFSTTLLDACDVVVDAVLGVGLVRAIEGELAQRVGQVNASGKPVVAADIPSGIHADTGAIMGTALRAALTVTFVALKAGLFTGRAPAFCGEILFDALGTPAASDVKPLAVRIAPDLVARVLPQRARDAHKGTFGHVVVIGGGRGMPGAARLCGEGALRAGAGRVSVAVWPDNVVAITATRPELMCAGVENADALAPLLSKADVLAIGPGLGQDVWSEQLWQRAVDEAALPRVLDADALNWLAQRPLSLTADDVITPHPGEAARLLGCGVGDVEADRFAAVARLARQYGCSVVLKSAGTLVADSDGRIAVCDRGTPAMATAGTGDVLAGVIAALRAQGLDAFDAACAGVMMHALAGERAARAGERGMLAGDLLAEIRICANEAPSHE